jgi:hypothetical protein
MRYFNGFSLRDEERFFGEWLIDSEFCVAGFSYGAQQALEYVLGCDERIDRLILLSPAYFQEQSTAFIRTQLRYFAADSDAYISRFLANVVYPSSTNLKDHLLAGTQEELSSLLCYRWEEEKLCQILKKGTIIEVILGEKDKIIDVDAAYRFFAPLVTTYMIKDAGHLLITTDKGVS